MKMNSMLQPFLFLAIACLSQSAFSANKNVNILDDLTGIIEYRSTDTNEWRGEDQFRLTIHTDKSKTMRITNRLDDTLILRDAILRVDKDYQPLDFYVSHFLDGVHRGTAFYLVKGSEIEAVINAPNGVLRQTIKVDDRFSIALRPQASFGWHFGNYDFEKRGSQMLSMYIVDRVGDSVGSVLGNMQKFNATLLSEEKLKVGAGVFDSWHFELTNSKDSSNKYEVWVEKENLLTLKLVVESAKRVYELMELRETYSN